MLTATIKDIKAKVKAGRMNELDSREFEGLVSINMDAVFVVFVKLE